MFRNEYKTIKKSGLFDEKYYLEIYEDVRKADIDPIKHYIKNGWKEGRNPSKKFNTNDYIKENNISLNSKFSPLFNQIKSLSNKQKATFSEYNIIKKSNLLVVRLNSTFACEPDVNVYVAPAVILFIC